MPELPITEHLPKFGSQGAAKALADRLEQLGDSCQDHEFDLAAETVYDAVAWLTAFAGPDA